LREINRPQTVSAALELKQPVAMVEWLSSRDGVDQRQHAGFVLTVAARSGNNAR
jgi:hypothetical protein